MYPAVPSSWAPDAGRSYRAAPSTSIESQSPAWRTAWQTTGWPASSSSSAVQSTADAPSSSSSTGAHRRTQSSQQLRQQYWHDKAAPYGSMVERGGGMLSSPQIHSRHVSDHQRQYRRSPPNTYHMHDVQQSVQPDYAPAQHMQHQLPPTSASEPLYASRAVYYHGMPAHHTGGETALSSPTSQSGPTRSRSMRSESDREEANRQKSKRHYDRKKVQRAALADLTAEYAQAIDRMRASDVPAARTQIFLDVVEALALRLSGTQDPATAAGALLDNQENVGGAQPINTVKRANERKRLNKLMQRQLEMQRIQQLSHVSRSLEAELRRRPQLSSLLVATEAGGTKDFSRVPEWSTDAELRAALHLLQPWLVFRSAWANLLLAEERLSLMAGRPLARMVTALRTVVNENRPSHHRQASGTSAGTDTSSL